MTAIRSLVLPVFTCLALLLGGVQTASAGGFDDSEIDFDTGATVDFGSGTLGYRAVGTVPARVKADLGSTIFIADVEGLRYNKEDPSEPGPAYFDITDGTYRNTIITDPNDPTLVRYLFQWRVELVTDDGVEYRSRGIIVARSDMEERMVWNWTGPIIEP